MKRAGYGNKSNQEKSLKAVFEETVTIAKNELVIIRKATGLKKKCNRMRKEYSTYLAKLKHSGHDGYDLDLYDKLPFYKRIHEFERSNARHNPPAVLSTATFVTGSDDSSTKTSTKKRFKRELVMTIEELETRNQNRHNDLLSEIIIGNECRAQFNTMFAELIKKL